MKKTLIAIATISLLSLGLSAQAATYKNCTAVNKEYPGGVALSADSKNLKTSKGKSVEVKSKKLPTVDATLYEELKKLDKDKDGIACEK
jgi:hypothetical protein